MLFQVALNIIDNVYHVPGTKQLLSKVKLQIFLSKYCFDSQSATDGAIVKQYRSLAMENERV